MYLQKHLLMERKRSKFSPDLLLCCWYHKIEIHGLITHADLYTYGFAGGTKSVLIIFLIGRVLSIIQVFWS